MQRVQATYLVRSEAPLIEARAQALAVEQSVEMPLAAISSAEVLRDIVADVHEIVETEPGLLEVRIGLSAATMGLDSLPSRTAGAMREAPAIAGWAKKAIPGKSLTRRLKFETPKSIGATITATIPSFCASRI